MAMTFKPDSDNTPDQISALDALRSSSPGAARKTSLKIETTYDLIESDIPSPYKILIWGKSDVGKTHFGLTFPSPVLVAAIDQRYKIIVKKFRTCRSCGRDWVTSEKNTMGVMHGGKKCPYCNSVNIQFKDIRGVSCPTVDLVVDVVDTFLDILQKEYKETGRVGTIILDSATSFWENCRDEYSIEKSGVMSGENRLSPRDDYGKINARHNVVRNKMMTCDFNVIFTSLQKNLYNDPNDQFKVTGTIPDGHKENISSVDWEIRNVEGEIIKADGEVLGNGIYTSYIKKNSIVPITAAPINFLNYEKMLKVRERLERECGMNEMPDKSPEEELPEEPIIEEGDEINE